MAEKMKTSEEKALKAIINSEASRKNYSTIHDLLGRNQASLTQVDVLSDRLDPSSVLNTLSNKEEVEAQILQRNRKHSLQSLATPFMLHPILSTSIAPNSPSNRFANFLDGSFLSDLSVMHELSDSEKSWISSLHRLVNKEISLQLSIDDFKKIFQSKQERTASSPSGRHFGHYRSLLECIRWDEPMIPALILDIAFISLNTASPLKRWQVAFQVMFEKGKGRFVENLRIIQLCEADLNFVLHTIWGHRLIHHAHKHGALSSSRYTLPGQTCNNAVLNKVLFLDLSR